MNNMKNENTRESNLELLRIFAIIMIIMHHLFYHSINPQVLENVEGINNIIFYKRLVLTDLGALLGKIGNVIFILISGYFLCNKPSINISKQIKKIMAQVLFVSLLLIGTSTIYTLLINKGNGDILLLDIINNAWWFIGYYISIIIIGYLFLNRYVISLDRKKYRNLVISLFAIITFPFSRELLSSLSTNLSTLFTGVFIYCLGGYIKKYKVFDNYKTGTIIIMIFLILGLVVISYINGVNNNINQKSLLPITKAIYYNEYSIVAISLGVCIFELFKRLKIKNNKIINSIAKSCFITYLIHENSFARFLFNQPNWCYLYKNNMLAFIIEVFGIALLIFIIGLLVYLVYWSICRLASSKTFKSLFLKEI